MGYINTVTFNTVQVGTIVGGSVQFVGSLSDLGIDTTKDWENQGITNINTLNFSNTVPLYPDGDTMMLDGTFRIGGNLIVDGDYPGGASSISIVTIDADKDWGGKAISNLGSIVVGNTGTITSEGTGTIIMKDTVHITGDLIVDGSSPEGVTNLSGLTINTTKDWEGYGITNIATIETATGAKFYSTVATEIVSDATLRPAGYEASDGQAGISSTITFGSNKLIIKNGIIVGTSIATGFPYGFPIILG